LNHVFSPHARWRGAFALLCALFFMGGIFVANAAWAQQSAVSSAPQVQAAADSIPQVVVTGSRFNEEFRAGTAVGTTVITAEDISRSGATNVYEAMRRLGGLQTRANLSGTSDDTIDLRGFGVSGDQNTLVLIDGQRVSENELQSARLSSVPLASIERIEIIRGSGAVLYGGGASGGVINVITKSARADGKSLTLGVLAGSYNTTDLRANGGIASSSVAVDFAANRLRTDNYRDNNSDSQENTAAGVRLLGEQGEVGLHVAGQRERTRLPGALSAAQYAADPQQAATPNDYTSTDANRYSLYGNYRWSQVELAADAYHRDKVDRFYNDFGPGNGTQYTRSGSSIEGISPRMRVTAPLFGQENQLVVGYDASRWTYRNQEAFLATGVATESDLGTSNLSSDETGGQHNHAGYFKDDLKIGSVRLTAGARRENVQQSTDNPLTSLAVTTMQRDLHAEEIGAAWSINPHWVGNARMGNSYRIGNIDENRFRFPTPGFLQPQTSKDTEAGVSYLTQPLDVDFRAFSNRLENEIMFVPGALIPPFGENINLPPTKRVGEELTAKWRPLAALDINAFYTHMHAWFRGGSFDGIDLSQREVPMVPRQRANLSADWRVTERDAVNLGWQYVGSEVYDNDQANTFGSRMPSYSLIDAKYTRHIGNVDLSLIGNNLTNRGYLAYGVIGAGGASNVYPARRRGLFASATVKF
jgi:iron complex outermembrane receptor protein